MVYTFFNRNIIFLKVLKRISTLLIAQVLDLVLSHSDKPSSLFRHSGPNSISKSRVMNLEGISSIRFGYRVKSTHQMKRVVPFVHTPMAKVIQEETSNFQPEIFLSVYSG